MQMVAEFMRDGDVCSLQWSACALEASHASRKIQIKRKIQTSSFQEEAVAGMQDG